MRKYITRIYITRISAIILFLSLTSCEACKDKPRKAPNKQSAKPDKQSAKPDKQSAEQDKQSAEREKQSAGREKLKTEIKELELKRKQQIGKLMDEWEENKPLDSFDSFEEVLKQGEIDKIYQQYIKEGVKPEANKQNKPCDEKFIQECLENLKEKVKNEADDYTPEKFCVAVLEKSLYKIYKVYFLGKYLNTPKKQEVKDYFEQLEQKDQLNDEEKKDLQLIRNWKAVALTLKLEQEKREALKKLEEAKKS